MKKFKIYKIFKKEKKKEEIFKKGLRTRGIGLVLLRLLLKKKKIINQNFQFLQKNLGFPNFFFQKIKIK